MPSQASQVTLVELFDDLLRFMSEHNAKVLTVDDMSYFQELDGEIAERCAAQQIEIGEFAIRERGVRVLGFVRMPFNSVTRLEITRNQDGTRDERPSDKSIVVYNLMTWADAIRAARAVAEEMGL